MVRWKRREFLLGISQSALALLMAGRAEKLAIAQGTKPTSVLVLGDGLSGLYTAWLLEAAGVSVTVLEARDRVGDRVYTLEDLPGKPEAGGQGFSEKYKRLLTLAQILGVQTEPVKPDRELLLNVKGESMLPPDWKNAAVNQLTERERSIMPLGLMRHYLRPDNPLKDAKAWTSPQYFNLDISLEKYLRTKGASPEALRLMNVYPFSGMTSDRKFLIKTPCILKAVTVTCPNRWPTH
ncbi:MAG: FAD-dependent oxidoreductase [Hormoscilla sp. SP5CHS1]|nr:FAD-dependent oxidoreductase [Hormoscilla sp. SP5CHS1]